MEYGLTACIVSAAACYAFGALALGGPRLGAALPGLPQRASERTSTS